MRWGCSRAGVGGAMCVEGGRTSTVSGAHMDGEEETYTIHVTIHHWGAPDAVTTSTATVTDATLTAGPISTVTGGGGGLTAPQIHPPLTDAHPPPPTTRFPRATHQGRGPPTTPHNTPFSATAHFGGEGH